MMGRTRIYQKVHATKPIVMVGSWPTDQIIGCQHVYVSGGLLPVVIATDRRFDMPATIYCRFMVDESPAPPRIAHLLTVDLFWKIVADATKSMENTDMPEETKNAISQKLANLQEFVNERRNINKPLPFHYDDAIR